MSAVQATRFGIVIISFGALMSSGEMVAAADYYNPKVGEPHADFVLPRIDNREPVRLSQYRGKKVLLIQFASW